MSSLFSSIPSWEFKVGQHVFDHSVDLRTLYTQCYITGLPHDSDSEKSACNARDRGLIPGSWRSPGEGNGNPLQYSCLENPMDWSASWVTDHGVIKSQTRLKRLSTCSPAHWWNQIADNPVHLVVLEITDAPWKGQKSGKGRGMQWNHFFQKLYIVYLQGSNSSSGHQQWRQSLCLYALCFLVE